MKHEAIVRQLAAEAESDPNVLGFLLFGSVAAGAQREDSDIDVVTILRAGKPSSGINNRLADGLKVGNLFFTYDVIAHGVETVPYLLHPLAGARVLFDREGSIEPLVERIRSYFSDHPEIAEEWAGYYRQLKEEKAKYGCEKTTIMDVWNELEKEYSGGKTRRRFFNSFYMADSHIFSLLKKFL